MARINVYLPDELAAEAKNAGVNLSAVTQDAVRLLLDARSTDAWLATVRSAPPHLGTHDRALEALDGVRDEPSTHHG